jgi:hypothetical protein
LKIRINEDKGSDFPKTVLRILPPPEAHALPLKLAEFKFISVYTQLKIVDKGKYIDKQGKGYRKKSQSSSNQEAKTMASPMGYQLVYIVPFYILIQTIQNDRSIPITNQPQSMDSNRPHE